MAPPHVHDETSPVHPIEEPGPEEQGPEVPANESPPQRRDRRRVLFVGAGAALAAAALAFAVHLVLTRGQETTDDCASFIRLKLNQKERLRRVLDVVSTSGGEIPRCAPRQNSC